MNFQLTTEQRMIRDLAREFTEKEIFPVAAQFDREDKFPHEIHRKALELGLLHLTVPDGLRRRRAGRLRVGPRHRATGLGLLRHRRRDRPQHGRGRRPDRGRHRSPEAKVSRPNSLRGEFGCYAATEPGAGSDVAGLQTRAERRGDRYVINGTKIWISNATVANFAVVFAKTDPARRASRV